MRAGVLDSLIHTLGHTHVQSAMRLFSPARVLATLCLLSTDVVRSHVEALTLEPTSEGESCRWPILLHVVLTSC
jgi:hypothetical protein